MSMWLDCSGSYAIVPSPAQVAQLKALGFVGAVVGSSYNHPRALKQLAAFEAGGITTEEYQFPSAPRLTTRPWWVDAELPDATLGTLRRALRNGSCGPYTRRGWAQDNLPNWDCKAEFPQSELWDARYVHSDTDPCPIQGALATGGDVKAAIARELSWLRPFKPYWGFTQAKMTQWHNSITIAGVNMDINERVDSPEEDEMSPMLWCIMPDSSGRLYYCPPVAQVHARWITTAAEAEALTRAFGAPKVAVTYGDIVALGG